MAFTVFAVMPGFLILFHLEGNFCSIHQCLSSCSCPMVNVPGFTHPVTEYFLDDIKGMIKGAGTSPQQWLPGNQQGKRLKPNENVTKVEKLAVYSDFLLTSLVIQALFCSYFSLLCPKNY